MDWRHVCAESTPTTSSAATSDCARHIYAMLHVEPGTEFQGPLTCWPSYIWDLHAHYCGRALDAFSLRLTHCFTFSKPLPVMHAVTKDGVITESRKAMRMMFRPYLPDNFWRLEGRVMGSHYCLAARALEDWGLEVPATPLLALRYPMAFAQAVMNGEWEEVICLASWGLADALLRGYPSQRWLEACSKPRMPHTPCSTITTLPLAPIDIQSLIENLRRWAPTIAAAATSEDESGSEKMAFSQSIEWLQHLLYSLEPPKRHHSSAGSKHQPSTMVASHLVAHSLRNADQLRSIAAKSLEMLLPDLFANDVMEKLVGKLPTGNFLRRDAVVFDASAILLQRHRNRELRLQGRTHAT